MLQKKIKSTRHDKPQHSQPELDWDATTWTFTEVFNAFLLPEWEVLKHWSERILQELKGDKPQELIYPLHAHVQQRLCNWLRSKEIVVDSKMALHPAVWLRLLHFIGECVNIRFTRLMKSYLQWCNRQPVAQLIISKKDPITGKLRRESMDIFLLRSIDALDPNTRYKFSWLTTLKSTPQNIKDGAQGILLEQSAIGNKITKIGKVICRNVYEMIAMSDDNSNYINGLYPMKPIKSPGNAKVDYRKYQFQGSALKLVAILKRKQGSLLNTRSDEVIAKAVRLYVKCS